MPIFNSTPGPRKMESGRRRSEAELRQVFMQFDSDYDNCLSKQDIKKAFNYLGALFPGFRANVAFNMADTNKDGLISLDELDAVVKYASDIGL
ncbi:hypothetical protein Tsubulata_015926 [Turnera subulata]|uniref:EF-hand domain-containing protein n=1 Tax=Turnera subulata TaxID=218843 RepID=A0A9Q0JCI8_9ROSI|nr:hypothetical protein Tsubulata_015926 [Turnera subulata]